MEFIGALSIILILTYLAGKISKANGIPAVIGQLLVGIVLGKAGFDYIHSNEIIVIFSEIGVILLMFIAGLESDLELLKKYFKPAILVAMFGVVLPITMGLGSGLLLNESFNISLFIGLILAATSVSISVDVLKELKKLDTKEGSTILGAAIADDIIVVFAVSALIPFLVGNEKQGAELLIPIIYEVLFFIFYYFVIKWFSPLLLKFSKRDNEKNSVIIMSLVICFAMSYLAFVVGLSSVIGAFLAGVAVGRSKKSHMVLESVETIGYSVFIPVFFVSIGLNVVLDNFMNQLPFILVFLIIAITSKLFGGYLGARIFGFKNNSSWMIGSGMVSRGEMALIIVQIGRENNLITGNVYSSMIIVILLSTLVSPLMLKYFTKRIYKLES